MASQKQRMLDELASLRREREELSDSFLKFEESCGRFEEALEGYLKSQEKSINKGYYNHNTNHDYDMEME